MIWTIWHWVAQGRRRRTDERTRLLDYTPGECANSRPKCQPAKPTVHISPKNVIKVALLMWIIWNWAAQDERRRTRRRILPKTTTKLILLEVLQKFCWEMSKMTQRYPYSGSLFPFQNTKISTVIGGIIVVRRFLLVSLFEGRGLFALTRLMGVLRFLTSICKTHDDPTVSSSTDISFGIITDNIELYRHFENL